MELADLLSDMRDRPVWQDDGLCAEVDPELWFPEKGAVWRDAKRLCQRCPVREQCLAHALERPERFGVWGGLSVREREAMARRMKIDQIGAAA